MNKLLQHKGSLAIHSGGHIIYYHNAPVHWIRAHAVVPYFCSERDGEKVSTQLKPLKFKLKEQAFAASGVICSSLFFIWWLMVSDCYHLNKREVMSFPIDLSDMYLVNKLVPIAKRLNDDMLAKSRRRVYFYKTSGRVEYDEFYLKLSKSIIDEIDRVLAQHYSLTDEELDFIINYDIKYRMGNELLNDEAEKEKVNKPTEEPQTVKDNVQETRYRVKITKEQASQGVSVAIPTDSGEKITIQLPAGISDGKLFKVKDRNLLVIASVEG